jgi:hypothetical protein
LQKFLAHYAQLNQQQLAVGNSTLYALEFYDYFNNNFWQIEPIGPQGIRQSADRTKLSYYRFRWVGIQSIGTPIFGTLDAIAQTVSSSAAVAAVNAARSLAALTETVSLIG